MILYVDYLIISTITIIDHSISMHQYDTTYIRLQYVQSCFVLLLSRSYIILSYILYPISLSESSSSAVQRIVDSRKNSLFSSVVVLVQQFLFKMLPSIIVFLIEISKFNLADNEKGRMKWFKVYKYLTFFLRNITIKKSKNERRKKARMIFTLTT